jgi:hypothetical protein
MLNDEAKNDQNSVQVTGESETLNAEGERDETRKGNWREVFRISFDRARHQYQAHRAVPGESGVGGLNRHRQE